MSEPNPAPDNQREYQASSHESDASDRDRGILEEVVKQTLLRHELGAAHDVAAVKQALVDVARDGPEELSSEAATHMVKVILSGLDDSLGIPIDLDAMAVEIAESLREDPVCRTRMAQLWHQMRGANQ